MWLMTKYGFFSAVSARTKKGRGRVNPDRIMIRARVRKHLENLKLRFPELTGQIVESKITDYRFRVFTEKKTWIDVAAELAAETDYDNFKSAVKAHQGKEGDEYVHALHDVWWTMLSLQEGRGRLFDHDTVEMVR